MSKQTGLDRRAVLTVSLAGAAAASGPAGAAGGPVRADVIVVGGGFSGLAAARAVQAAGRSVIVLEARDRVGGRVMPGRIAGLTIDLGGMWLGPTQTRLAVLAQHYGVATYPTYLTGKNLIEVAGRRGDGQGEDAFSALEPDALADFAGLVGALDVLVGQTPADAPWTAPDAERLDQVTFASWLDANAKTLAARTLFEMLIRALLCAEPKDVSLLFVLFYLRSGEGLTTLISSGPGGAQNLLFVGGLHQISARMAADLGGAVRLSEPVRSIRQDANGVEVISDRGRYVGRQVIVALPPPLAGKIEYEPLLPHDRDALTQRMPMGSAIKVWIAYETPFWREQGMNGSVFSDRFAFGPAFDATPPGQPHGIIAGFFDAAAAGQWSPRTSAERRAEVLRALVDALGPKAGEPMEYVEQDWTAERWSRGCYGAFAPPGVLSAYGPALRAPVGRLHWAGTETASVWSGYVEGAIRAGERAAAEALAQA